MAEKLPAEYSAAILQRVVQDLEKRIDALQRPKLRRIKSVAAEAAQNLAVNEPGYVLGDTGQNFDLVVRAEDSRIYRITGAASTSGGSSGSGGTNDHGALTGLADDDHTQYHTDARGDVRYPLKSLLTTKGDLFVRDASAVNRIGIGTDGQVLTADSVQALGVKWASTAPGVSTFIDLTDTDPTTYVAQAGKVVEVNTGETGLQFGQKLRTTDSPTFASIVISPVTSGNVLSANGSAFVSVTPDAANLVTKDGVQTISGAKTFSDNLVVNTGKEFRLYDVDNSNYVGFVAPSLAANKIWALPNADGTVGQVLKTDGAGNLGWVTAGGGGGSPGGSDTQVQFNDGGAFGGDAGLVYNKTTNVLTITSGALVTPKIYPASDSTTAVQILKADGTTNVLNVDTTNIRIGIGTAAPAANVEVNNTTNECRLKIFGDNPVLSFTGDANSGVNDYYIAAVGGSGASAGRLAIGKLSSTNGAVGTELITISNAARVGINVLAGTDENAMLDIKTPNSTSTGFYVDASTHTVGPGGYVAFILKGGAAAFNAFNIIISGEVHSRAVFSGDGKYGVGPGSATRDTFLERNTSGGWLLSASVLVQQSILSNATTAAVDNVVTVGHNSTGTPAAGFGSGLIFQLESSTTDNQNTARFTVEWVVATHASRTARSKWSVFDYNAEREVLRIEGDGSAGRFGAFGVTAVIRPTAYTQTYATATKTHAARTAATLTDSSGGTANTTVEALPDPADTPVTADALRDDIVTNLIPALRNNFADLAAQINALKADLDNTAQFANQQCDDLQGLGWLS